MNLQLGQIPAFIVSSPEIASEIMKTHDLKFCSRPTTLVMKKFSYGGLDIAFSKYGVQWRQMRKLGMLEIFSTKRVQSFKSVREEEVHILIQSIRHSCSQTVNLSDMFLCMSNNIICREVFGKRFSDDGECNRSEHHDLVLEIMELIGGFSLGDFFPSLKYWLNLFTGWHGKLERNFKRMDELFEREIEEHSSSLYDDHGHEEEDFLDVLLKLQKDFSLGFSLTKDHIKAILMNMFLGGTDTSALTLEWAMTELMRNPTLMKKAQDEVRGVVGSKGKVEESDLQQLQYMKLIVSETLRLHCIARLLLPRESMEECQVNGYIIPEKSRVYINAWAICNDPKAWENPEVFMPERFEGNDISYRGQHFEFIPFGAGRRICPGMQKGIAVVEITLANMLYHFKWKTPSETGYKGIDTRESFGVVLHKKSPLVLQAAPIET
ncbi:cytochrome P450 71A1-like [Dioscorea cayenensis subsp. rotundata]|uniref:Cytochrome P450 71A1-like n=1 Tax=Dioscorea cayennensis subsp. rotundata TaxID=55577 RepID=A0AB40D2U4_DIOCR|nr:cytochrome P450 71A1-like [Dioscorea cayenensis subsp. rotundata]